MNDAPNEDVRVQLEQIVMRQLDTMGWDVRGYDTLDEMRAGIPDEELSDLEADIDQILIGPTKGT